MSAINNLLILLFVLYIGTQIHNNYLRVFLNFFGIIDSLKVMLRFSKNKQKYLHHYQIPFAI